MPAQVIDPHTHQYLDRLKDEPLFLALAQKVSDHLARTGDTKSLARVALRRIEHFYYKTDAVYDAMRKLALQQKEAANVVQVCSPAMTSAADKFMLKHLLEISSWRASSRGCSRSLLMPSSCIFSLCVAF